MALHNELGKEGEAAAEQLLLQKGYRILERNWRFRKNEIDLIALKDGIMVFVEVKSRRNTELGNPQDAVDMPKIRRTVTAAEAYIRKKRFDGKVRFDLICVVGLQPPYRTEHIEQAFYPPLEF